MPLASNINDLRKANNLSQEKLAEMIDVTRQTIANWEAGITMPNPDQLVKISKIFNVSIDELTDNKNFIFNNHLNDKKIKKNNINKYKLSMILSFVTCILFLISGINMFISWCFSMEIYQICLGCAFLCLAFLWIGIAFMYKKKYKKKHTSNL